jgi:hypothetical protein
MPSYRNLAGSGEPLNIRRGEGFLTVALLPPTRLRGGGGASMQLEIWELEMPDYNVLRKFPKISHALVVPEVVGVAPPMSLSHNTSEPPQVKPPKVFTRVRNLLVWGGHDRPVTDGPGIKPAILVNCSQV